MSSFKYVVAIVAPEVVESLESKLRSLHVGGITLTKVRGFGEYKNFYTRDWLSDHTKVEIFVEESAVDGLVDALLETAGSDIPGSGIVAVLPVDRFLHLRTRTESLPVPGHGAEPDPVRRPA